MRPKNAPRCFGLPTAFGAAADICGDCAVQSMCGPVAKSLYEKIKQQVDAPNVGSMHVYNESGPRKKAEPKVATATPKATTSKLQKLIEQILKAAPDVIDKLNNAQNPFTVSTKPAFLKPFVDVVLAEEGHDKEVELLMVVFNKSRVEAEKQIALFNQAIDVIAKQQESK